jgi:hypothetical protein
MKNFFILLALFSSLTCYGQKLYKGNLLLENGSKVEGMIKIPTEYDKKVTIKKEGESKKEKIASDQIKKITLDFNGEQIYFVRESVENTFGKKVGPFWYQMLIEGYASLYVGGGHVYSNHKTGANVSDVSYYAKRPNEEIMSVIGVYFKGAFTVGKNTSFRISAAKYFEDSPEILAKINNKEYGLDDVAKLIEDYNNWKKSKK